MAEECTCEVRCSRCGSWFPYPAGSLRFGSWDEYYASSPPRRTARCPKCGEETELKEHTTRFGKKRT
ncbi:MAG: hypothetical protein LUQ69_07585 [Methanoregulaceae archaeon]|nr:hypothetical protein [Methanoregulaceae archaeon]